MANKNHANNSLCSLDNIVIDEDDVSSKTLLLSLQALVVLLRGIWILNCALEMTRLSALSSPLTKQ